MFLIISYRLQKLPKNHRKFILFSPEIKTLPESVPRRYQINTGHYLIWFVYTISRLLIGEENFFFSFPFLVFYLSPDHWFPSDPLAPAAWPWGAHQHRQWYHGEKPWNFVRLLPTIVKISSSDYLTLRSVSSLNNPQNTEMKLCENMKLTCWKSS